MALPGRDKTFAFENCRDMLLKLEREIDRYKTALFQDNVQTLQDAAFNTCVTAWHLCDWVFNDSAFQRSAIRKASVARMSEAKSGTHQVLCKPSEASSADRQMLLRNGTDDLKSLPQPHQ